MLSGLVKGILPGCLLVVGASAQQGFGVLQDLVAENCADCHDGDVQKGGLDLEARAGGDLVVWLDTLSHVRRRVAAGEMPPADAEPGLSEADRQRLLDFCSSQLRELVPQLPPAPGRVTVRRLSRAEWEYSVFDLFGIQTEAAAAFPNDDLSYGFDNIGDALSFSTLHLEKYLDAAQDVAAQVMHGEDPAAPVSRRFEAEVMRRDAGIGFNLHLDHAKLTTRSRLAATVELPRDGIYRIRISASATQAGDEFAKMALAVDGRELEEFEIKQTKMHVVQTSGPLRGGSQKLTLAFTNDFFDPDNPDKARRDRNLMIDWFEITGPLDPRLVPPQQEWFAGADAPDKPPLVRIRRRVAAFLPRLWRRPVTDAEIKRISRLGEQMLADGEPLHRAERRCLTAALVSPNFLFRVEAQDEDAPAGSGGVVDVPGQDLAVRLSYLLWSSVPDEQLLEVARAGRLSDPEVVEEQFWRMLRDPRAGRLAANFAAQWLELRALDAVTPDPDRFPGFDDELARAMRRESELLFYVVLREGLDVRTLIDSDFTHLNQRLADFYGLDLELGERFRRVDLPEDSRSRGGVLGHAGIHVITSNPTRTSPVKRGKWILENLLDQPPPPPPPGNDSFPDSGAVATARGLREQMELHRSHADCASCHIRMDALGLSLERFDAVGRWRTTDGEEVIDASGELPGGQVIDGLAGLKDALVDDPAYTRALARKLFVYAVGRDLEPADRLKLDLVVDELRQQGKVTLADLLLAVIRSDGFRRRQAGS
ncbi:MAG: DUF1592 domain-containing protein [Planctomycetota bacterium]|nr:DUF1592 domain-containing protein [Planctomycetota bacterium]